MVPACTPGAYNINTVSNDAGIFYAVATNNNQGLNIGPWSNTGGGIRLDSAGNVKVNGTLAVTGITYLNPTGTTLSIGGSNYSASTVQAALALPSTPTFTGNITLPTLSATPTASQLGFTNTTLGASQTGLQPSAITNLTSFILYAGVYMITGTMHFQTPETGIAFNQIVTAISTTSQGYDSQSFGFVRTYGNGSGGGTAGYVYSQQVQRIMTLYAQTTVYLVGTVSATYMTTWQIPDQKCCMHAVKIA